MDPIQLFVSHFAVDETLAEVRECLERGWTGMGYKTQEFEARWGEYTGLPNSLFLNSATAGLHLAVRLLKSRYAWNYHDEVITTPITFVSTNHAIMYEGLQPVFADVDCSLCLDPASVKKLINKRTRAVMFVGLGGNTGQLHAVEEICKNYGLRLILDAAHMAGTRWSDTMEHVGKGADATVFSFQAVKNLPTADSGMLCLRDVELADRARKLSWLGINKDTYARSGKGGTYAWDYDVEAVGYKYNGNSIMAAIGLVALRHLDEDNECRRAIARLYDELLMPAHRVLRVPVSTDCIPSRHLYQVRVEEREKVIAGLNAARIFPGVHYKSNMEYTMYRRPGNTCPNATTLSQKVLSLPMHMRLNDVDIERVVDNLTRIVEER
jgi:dTDP-4-amino-4,6-dideoxygalactose transaminase